MTDLVTNGKLDGSNGRGAHHGAVAVEALLEAGQQLAGLDQRQLSQALGHHVTRPLLLVLETTLQASPTQG